MAVTRITAAVGAILVMVSFLRPYNTSGVGSAIDGRGVADLLLSGTLDSWAPRWIGAALYLIPLGGALVLLGLGLDGRPAHALIGIGAAASTVVYVVLVLALETRPVTSPGSGSILMLLGLGLWAVAGTLVLLHRRRRTA